MAFATVMDSRSTARASATRRSWCVFDRDSFPAQAFNTALQKARSAGISVAYSNESFELWYLLHYDYPDAALSRSLYGSKLTDRLGRSYKNDPTLFDVLRTRQEQVIRNARELLASYGPSHNPEKDNPSTTVHEIVEELNAQAAANAQDQSRK